MPKTGLKIDAFSFKDFSHEAKFGSATPGEIIPLGRIEQARGLSLPVVCQGDTNSCVSCAATWIKQYLEASGQDLSWEWLAKVSKTGPDGASVRQVLEPARKVGICEQPYLDKPDVEAELNAAGHKLGSYYFLRSLDRHSVYQALRRGPLLVGVHDYEGFGDHAMVLVDVTEEGAWVVANWWNPAEQEYRVLPADTRFALAVSFSEEIPESKDLIRMPKFDVLKSKAKTLVRTLFSPENRHVSWGALAFLGVLLLVVPSGDKFGAAGVVANYDTTLSSSITNTATTVPVSSVTLKTGETFSSTDLHFPIYLTIDPGSQYKEDVECWGLTSLSWTGCIRGLSSKGGAVTSTVSGANRPHSAGTRVIMSNVPYFFNRFVDDYSDESIAGAKTFTGHLTFSNASTSIGGSTASFIWDGTNLGWTDNGIDTYTFVSATSGLTASSTEGIKITSSKISVKLATSTYGAGLDFDSSGNLQVYASTTKYLAIDSDGRLYWDSDSLFGGDNTWTGSQSFTGHATYALYSSSSKDIVNMDALTNMVATGTAGEAFAAGAALYVKPSDGYLYKAVASGNTSTYAYIGMALDAAGGSGSSTRYARPGATMTTTTTMTVGSYLYLTNTAGAVGMTPGTNFAKVAQVMSANKIRLVEPKFITSGYITYAAAETGAKKITTGFYPAFVQVFSGLAGSDEGSFGDDSNSSVSMGTTYGFDTTRAITVKSGAGSVLGTIASKSQDGFTINIATQSSGGTAYIKWTAYSE
jgi:hypothetical protein